METSLIVSIVIATVAIVPGVISLIIQSNKDKAQAKLDSQTLAQNAALGIITPLREEVVRLQARVTELETDLLEKSKRITELEEALYEKDSIIRKLQYSLEGMKLRLDAVENGKHAEETSSETKEEEKEIK